MLGIQNRLLSIRDLGPRNGVPATQASRGAPRGDERILRGLHAAGTLAAAALLAIDEIEQQSAWRKAG
jgi:hypothetical protein